MDQLINCEIAATARARFALKAEFEPLTTPSWNGEPLDLVFERLKVGRAEELHYTSEGTR